MTSPRFALVIFGHQRAIGGRTLGQARYEARRFGAVDYILDTATGERHSVENP